MRRGKNGKDVPLATLEPPASFEESAAMGTEAIRWVSARARGPVSLLALGKSDLDALSDNFPLLANKVLMKLAGIMAIRLQLILDAQCSGKRFDDHSRPAGGVGESHLPEESWGRTLYGDSEA